MTQFAEEEPDFEFAADNPELLAAANALTQGERSATPPTIDSPLDGPVTLTVGYRRVKSDGDSTKFEDVRKAWVRELNGEDEERIARTRLKDDPNAFVQAVLEAGVESLGGQTPTSEDFASLVLGDRNYLLLEIAKATYGEHLEYEGVRCPTCGESFDVSISLEEDVPVKRLDKIEDATFEVRLKRDRVATVNLPTSEVTDDLGEATTSAEANTALIAHCVEEIRGPKGVERIAGDRAAALRLSVVDRQTLVNEMAEHMPGPQYNEVRFNHEPGCGKEVRLEVSVADLFRGL